MSRMVEDKAESVQRWVERLECGLVMMADHNWPLLKSADCYVRDLDVVINSKARRLCVN